MIFYQNSFYKKYYKVSAMKLSCIFFFLFSTPFLTFAQNTNYTPLYASYNFTKTIDVTKPLGVVQGSGSVNSSGGAGYSIPIYTPPGTAGLEPTISLTYNSQAGAGIAGFGWNITGLSAITRSGKDRYHNGTSTPVLYTALNDAFYMDGIRLNPVSGDNGADGTIYATESETFSTIISNTNVSPNNPSWFKVIAKDGSVMEFGNTSDSKFLTNTQVPKVIMWRLNKLIDVSGNYIEFKYDNINNNSRITQILYTGNINTGLQPYNQINFDYSLKSDNNTSFEGGATINSDYLLDKISIVHSNDASVNEVVKTYRLNYGFDNIHSMLKEIVEFGGEETASSLNSTILLYGDQPQNLVCSSTDQLNGTYDYSSGDFNGDGKTDLLQTTKYWNNDIHSFINTGFGLVNYIDDVMNGYGPGLMYMKNLPQNNSSIQTMTDAKLYNFLSSDYDGDGRDDVLEVKSHAVSYRECFGNGTLGLDKFKRMVDGLTINFTKSFNPNTGFTSHTEQNFPFPNYWGIVPFQYVNDNGNFFIPGDFDGDGNQDYILILAYRSIVSWCSAGGYGNYPRWEYYYKAFYTSPSTGVINEEIINFGVGANPYGVDYYARTIAEADKLNVFDFDGDGRVDILVTKGGTSYVVSVNDLSPSTGYLYGAVIKNTDSEITVDSKVFFGDFNGDKKTDILVRNNNATWKTLYSIGLNFVSVPFYFNNPVNLENGKIIVSDFNGDGLSDIVHAFNEGSSTGKISAYFSKGSVGANAFYNEQYYYNYIFTGADLIVGDFNGDGRSDIMNPIGIGAANGIADFITIKPFGQERLLQKITNGHNVTTSFGYKLLTDKTTSPYFYDRTISLDDPTNISPYNFVQLPMYAVSTMSVPDGIGGGNTTNYRYENALLNRAGKGFMGFKKVTSFNFVSNITTTTENEFNYQFATPYTVRQTTSWNGSLLTENIITNNFANLSTGYLDKRYLQTVSNTLSIDYLNGKASQTINTFDIYANIITNITKVGVLNGNNVTPSETTTTSTSFGIHNTPVPSLPDNITITNERVGMPAISATTNISYNAVGFPITKTAFAGLPKSVTTSFTYDVFGNQNLVTVSSSGLSSRTVKTVFDAKGRYPIEKESGFGTPIAQKETYIMDSKWGTPLSSTTSDCLTTTFVYNAFGKIIQTNMPDGNVIYYNDYWNINNNNLFFSKIHYAFGEPDTRVYYDILGREIKTEKASFYNADETQQKYHTVLTTYDSRGNIYSKSNSFFPLEETPRYTTNDYDVYNRPLHSINYMGTSHKSYTISGNGNIQVISSIPSLEVNINTVDPSGRIIETSDLGGQVTFTYDSRGNQIETKNGGVTINSSTYDIYGRQTSLTDVNAGTTIYDYNAYGELVSQTDAKGNTFTMAYDALGRLVSKLGVGANAYYEYYKDLNTGCSNNNLAVITNGSANPTRKELTYDGLSRVIKVKQTLNSIDYITSYMYDASNKLFITTYPSGNFTTNLYDLNGYLMSKTARTSSGKFNIFTNSVIDGEGRYKNYRLLNGRLTTKTYSNDFPLSTITPGIQSLTYNFQTSSGNLLQRSDNINSQTETFTYDNLKRLTSSTVNGIQQFGVTYDGTLGATYGNIATKTDAGYYTYRNDKIHAVAYTMDNPSNGQNTVFPPPVSVMPHAQQVISYNSFLKAANITEGNHSLNFEYGPDMERIKTVYNEIVNGNSETRIFLGDYEVQITPTGTREIEYIDGGDGLAAILVKENGITERYAAYSDYLGSITTLTDRFSNIVAQQNFDAWGRKRLPNNWNSYYATATAEINAVPVWLYRGYTGHEMLPLFTLINMNGRMYDPVLGRMLSPDNYLSTPYGTQSHNGYTYANNNPLMYTDPDGNFGFAIFPILVSAFVGGMHADMSGKGSFLGGLYRGAIVGVATAGLGSIGGGSFLQNIAYGAVEGVLINGLSNTLWGDPFFKSAGTAIGISIAFATISSGIEALRNYKEGYGFGTNVGRLNRMIGDYNAAKGTAREAATVQRAMDFVQKRYGLKGTSFSFDRNLGDYGSTDGFTGDVTIGPDALRNASFLKATMIHEYYHSNDRELLFGIWGFKLDPTIDAWNYNDGVGAYANEIKNSGKMHISIATLKYHTFGYFNGVPGFDFANPVWFRSGIVKARWFYLLPRRF